MERLKPYINGKFVESKTDRYMPIYNPSTGEQIAETPCCTEEGINAAIAAAKNAFPAWSNTPVSKKGERSSIGLGICSSGIWRSSLSVSQRKMERT